MTKFEKWCEEKGYDKDGVFTVCKQGDGGFVVGSSVAIEFDNDTRNPRFKSIDGAVDYRGDDWCYISFEQQLTQTKQPGKATTMKAGDKVKFNNNAVKLKCYDECATGTMINPEVKKGICSVEWRNESGKVFYTSCLSKNKVDLINEGFESGDSVRFSDKSVHLESYSQSAKGTILRKAVYRGKEKPDSWCVKFKYMDGTERTIPVISSKMLSLVANEEIIAKLEVEYDDAVKASEHIFGHYQNAKFKEELLLKEIQSMKQ